jgi:hypothetical protein
MKIKIIVIAMLLISLVNVASADHVIGSSPAVATIDNGEEQTFIVTISAVPDESLMNTFEVLGADEFEVTIDGDAVSSKDWTWDGSEKTFSVKVKNTNAANGLYKITFMNTNGQDESTALEALIQVKITSIPEFPTIALPVAAIIGLAFFMQRRKEE